MAKLPMKARTAVAVAAMIFAGLPFASPAKAADDAGNILKEIRQLEKQGATLVIQYAETTRAADALKPVLDRLQTVAKRVEEEKASLEAEDPMVDSLCSGAVPEDQYAAAVARCHAVMDPHNRRVDRVNDEARRLAREAQESSAKMAAIIGRQEEIREKAREVDGRIKALMANLEASEVGECAQRCAAKASEETSVECMKVCFDLASPEAANRSVVVPAKAKRGTNFYGSDRRTAEQAIEEYKRSGPANPGRSIGRSAVPPPTAASQK